MNAAEGRGSAFPDVARDGEPAGGFDAFPVDVVRLDTGIWAGWG